MRLILVGCEYAGKTTLAHNIVKWIEHTMGSSRTFHDHFTVPCPELGDEEQKQILAMTPKLKEMFQRYMIEYHLHPAFYSDPDHNLVGFHIEEAVYAPLYYGYGRKGEYAERTSFARAVEEEIMRRAPDTVLILLKASPDVIARRMGEHPHPFGLVQEKDIEYVLQRFEEEFRWSLIRRQFVLDTTTATVEETLTEFVAKIRPLLSDSDRLRMLTHRAWRQV
jgi:thymidylate kinase